MDTLTVQVWKLDFSEFKSPAAKLVALALARRSHESGASWARQALLATDCGVSKQTVHRCLEELAEAGWLKRVARRRKDGGRSSDMIWLTLPQITLNATTVDLKEAKRIDDDQPEPSDEDDAFVDSPAIRESAGSAPAMPPQPATVSGAFLTESLKDSDRKKDAREPLEDSISTAVELIWQKASKTGRERSSKADIAASLKAAIGRGHGIETILRGLGSYLASPDATKDDGAYQRGAHVMLAKDRFLSFVDDPAPATRADQVARTDLGTSDAPSDKLQRHWMTLFAQGMPWPPERGPQPGRLGCRVAGAVQREFGVEPFEMAQAEDEAAFD